MFICVFEIYYKDFLSDYSWTRVYTGCSFVQTDSRGESYSGTDHDFTSVTVKQTTCTQYGEEYLLCNRCGEQDDYRFVSPYDIYWWGDKTNSHDWEEQQDGTYKCVRCNTESTYGASGLITLEDMTQNGNLWIGYYNGVRLDITDINIIFNYQTDGSGIALENSSAYFQNEDTTPYQYAYHENRTSGIIKVNTEMLKEAINNAEGVETVSIVFWMALDSQTGGDSFFQAYALTFTLAEINNLK